MKDTIMVKMIWLALLPSLVLAETRPCTMRQEAVYVDVHSDKVIVCAENKEIAESELSASENEFEKLIQGMERVRNVRYPVLLLRPGSERLQHTLLKLIRKYDVDVGIEPWESERLFTREELVKNTEMAIGLEASSSSNDEYESMFQLDDLPLPTPLEAKTEGKEPVYFECRNNRLFSISMEQSAEAVRHAEGYAFDYPGEETNEKWFGSQLAKLDPQAHYIYFYVRPDSFVIFRKARQLTWYKNLDSRCELVDEAGPLPVASGVNLPTPGAAMGQSEITVEILETDGAGEIAPVDPRGMANRFDSQDGYVSCLTYMNPLNSADVMAQWTVIQALFRTNNVRIGMTMCSIGCGASIHVDDVERARQILQTAIRDRLIDNAILKMEIASPPLSGNAPPRASFAEP
jgi:hypothetical protein